MNESAINDVQRYREGDLSPEALRQLEERWRQSPGLRKELLVQSSFEAELPGALQELMQERAREEIPGATRPRQRILWGVAAALAAALVAVVGLNLLPPSRPLTPPKDSRDGIGRLTAFTGEVTLSNTSRFGRATAAVMRARLGPGDTLSTASNATARFLFADGSALRLYPNSMLIVGASADGPEMELRLGAVDATIQPQLPDRKMQVVGSRMRIAIVGTEFRLMADERSTWVGVRKGEVAVTRLSDNKQVILGDGNYAAVHPSWPFMRMNALVCPYWKMVCQKTAGSPYP